MPSAVPRVSSIPEMSSIEGKVSESIPQSARLERQTRIFCDARIFTIRKGDNETKGEAQRDWTKEGKFVVPTQSVSVTKAMAMVPLVSGLRYSTNAQL